MLSQFKRFVLLALSTAPVIISCGVSNPLKTGYYVSDSTSDSYYPLVVVKATNGKTVTYRVSQALSGGFGKGAETDTDSTSGLSLGTEIQPDGSESFTAWATQKGAQVRVRTLKMKGSKDAVTEEADVAKHEVLKDELLSSITKEEAIAQLNKLVTRSGSGSQFSASQEAECKGAFDMACADLFK